jgi:colanic acid biosynthesis glycosyl transferase WcaI
MKVLLLNQAFYPDSVATSQYVTDLAKYLVTQGHEVSVLCDRRDYTQRDRIYPAYEEFEGIQIHRLPSTGLGKRNFFTRLADAITYELCALWKLVVRIPRHDAVIAFTSPPLAGAQGALIAMIWRARFVYWIMNVNHEMAMEMGYLTRGSPLAFILTVLYRFTLRRADSIVVMDRWMKARVEKGGAIEPARILIVPLWPVHDPVVEEDDAGSKRTNSFRENLGLGGKFVVAHSGNLSLIHPLDTVLGAAIRLKDDPSIAFAFFGYGIREKDIDETVRRHGLTNVLKFPYQPREKLGHSLGFADLQLVVMGNAASGLAHSSKIYSILATGRPYLFIGPHDSHIVGDILEVCRSGYHIEHGDIEGFLRVIELVRNLTPEERRKYRQRSVAFVASRFTRELILPRFVHEALEQGFRSQNLSKTLTMK